MLYVLSGLFVFLMAVAGRAHGSASKDEITGEDTGWPTWDRLAAVILFAVAFGYANYATYHSVWLSLAAATLTVFAFNTGHGRFFGMQGANPTDPDAEFIEKAFGWLYPGNIHKPAYSWFCMGIKGLGVGLAAAPVGLLLIILWPFSYWFSWKFFDGTEVAEWVRGLFSGLVIVGALVLA